MRSSATALVAIALVSLPAMLAQVPDNTATKAPAAKEKSDAHDRKPVIRPMIPKADRHEPGKVFVEYADRLDKPMGSEAQVLIGNVQFRKGDMFIEASRRCSTRRTPRSKPTTMCAWSRATPSLSTATNCTTTA